MPYVNLFHPEIRDPFEYSGAMVVRKTYIGSGEFKSLVERVKISAEIQIKKNQQEHNAKWPDRLILGQHFNGQTQAKGTVTEHAFELRGRLFVDDA